MHSSRVAITLQAVYWALVDKGLVEDAGMGHRGLDHAGLYEIYVNVDPEKVSEVLAIVRGILADVQANGVTAAELEQAKVKHASAEVIAAAVEGMSLGSAQRLVQERQHTPLRDLVVAPARAYFPAGPSDLLDGVGVSSNHFIVQGRLRLGERVLEERSLIVRRQLDIVVLSRERVNLRDSN